MNIEELERELELENKTPTAIRGDYRIIAPKSRWWLDTLLTYPGKTGAEIIRKHVVVVGASAGYLRSHCPYQEENILEWLSSFENRLINPRYLLGLFDTVYEKSLLPPKQGRKKHEVKWTVKLKEFYYWLHDDPIAFGNAVWAPVEKRQKKGRPEIWYEKIQITVIPLWERKTWGDGDIWFPPPHVRGYINLNSLLVNGEKPRFAEITERILGGIIVGWDLINPVLNPRLALAVDRGSVASAG